MSIRRQRGACGVFVSVGRFVRPASILLLALLATACATTVTRPGRAYAPPTTVSMAATLSPSTLGAEVELDLLGRTRTNPALLRRAYLELQLGRAQSALDAAAEVLFGRTKPSANEEAFARYLRAEAYGKQGLPERGRYDLERATELAMDVELQRLLQSMQPAAPDAPPPVAAGLAITDRSAWRANAPNRANMDAMGKVTRITIHHSALLLRDARQSACATQIQRIQRDHMGERGYGDIGYHYLIDPSGRIWQGRDLRYQGAHANKEHNIGNVGICLLGNFMRGSKGQTPAPEQLQAMERLVVHLMGRYRLQADDLFCHSHFRNTECPGPLVEPAVARLQRSLQRGGALRIADAAAGL